MRVLGIDPGSRVTGLGLVDAGGDALRCIDYRCIRATGGELPPRLGEIYTGVAAMIRDLQPDVVAVEQVFVAGNPRSALVLGHARGSAICAAVNAGAPVAEYSALQIKQAVVGTGSAAKEQVQHMVRVLLGLRQAPPSDAADALGCAICHIHTARSASRLRAAVPQ